VQIAHTFASLAVAAQACRRCPGICQGRKALSPANGPVPAKVMIVGEAPGRLGAAITGIPFTSDVSARRLDRLLEMASLRRERVFLTNAILCNPLDPGGRNRRPTAREIDLCSPFFAEQLSLVQPWLVVSLGQVALRALASVESHNMRLSEAVGLPHEWHGTLVWPLYHPSARAAIHRPWALQVEDWRHLGAFLQVFLSERRPRIEAR
jgi:uracil-DNA glycosylase